MWELAGEVAAGGGVVDETEHVVAQKGVVGLEAVRRERVLGIVDETVCGAGRRSEIGTVVLGHVLFFVVADSDVVKREELVVEEGRRVVPAVRGPRGASFELRCLFGSADEGAVLVGDEALDGELCQSRVVESELRSEVLDEGVEERVGAIPRGCGVRSRRCCCGRRLGGGRVDRRRKHERRVVVLWVGPVC